jgi:hypothetical protein
LEETKKEPLVAKEEIPNILQKTIERMFPTGTPGAGLLTWQKLIEISNKKKAEIKEAKKKEEAKKQSQQQQQQPAASQPSVPSHASLSQTPQQQLPPALPQLLPQTTTAASSTV